MTIDIYQVWVELSDLLVQVPRMDSETVDRMDDVLSEVCRDLGQAIADRQYELMRLAKEASPVIVEVVVDTRNKAHDLIMAERLDETAKEC